MMLDGRCASVPGVHRVVGSWVALATARPFRGTGDADDDRRATSNERMRGVDATARRRTRLRSAATAPLDIGDMGQATSRSVEWRLMQTSPTVTTPPGPRVLPKRVRLYCAAVVVVAVALLPLCSVYAGHTVVPRLSLWRR